MYYYEEERKNLDKINYYTEKYREYFPYAAVESCILPGYTREKIEKELERERAFYDNVMRSMDKFSNHKPEFWGVDLSVIFQKFADSFNENMYVILVDKYNKEIYDYKKVTEGSLNSTGSYTYINLLKYLTNKSDEIIENHLSVVTVHNHPLSLPAIPSKGDLKEWESFEFIFQKIKCLFLNDHFVITPYDVYSLNQSKKDIKEEK